MDIDNESHDNCLIRFRHRRRRSAGHRRHYSDGRAGISEPAQAGLTETMEANVLPKGFSAASLAAWGYVFQVNTQTIAVGAPINYSNNGPLSGVNHVPGASRIEVVQAGIYSISFSVYTAQNNPQDWAVIVNGVQRSRFNSAGQTISGVTLLSLNAGDSITIRNINTSPDPARLRTGDFTTAYVLILKVN